MYNRLILLISCISATFITIFTPVCTLALDAGSTDIAVLDSQTFVVSKEFAGEIKLYVCSVRNGIITIMDSSSIPYMTIKHRDLSAPSGRDAGTGGKGSAILRTVP